ncbi:MAG: SlyX family protein [Desulfuromonadaceae bacterium]|nr:SlyX family protein [Desulfuromonadaceae bacterium]MDD5104718.1 SlyX family protein [Desulfuromonadaceae bacterium]
MERRIDELELRYMQQEHVVQDLNEIVCRQELEIEKLKRDFSSLKEQFLQISPSVTRDPGQEEPPPHY